MSNQMMVFQRSFPDGRLRNVWGVTVPESSTLFALAKGTGPRYVKSFVNRIDIQTLVASKLANGYVPLGLFETDGIAVGARVGDIDDSWTSVGNALDPIATTEINLCYAVDELVDGWPSLAKSFIEPFTSVATSETSIEFLGLKVATGSDGKSQGVLRVGHGLLCTALFLAIGPMIGKCTVTDMASNVVPSRVLDYEAHYIRSLGCSAEDVDAMCDELGLQPSLNKLLFEAEGGMPAF